MRKIYLSNNSAQTRKIGQVFAGKILQMAPGKKAVVVGLRGDLGAGKTTFLQGFARGLGIKERVFSPTFLIFKKFRIKVKNFNLKPENLFHIDCYRIEKPKDLIDLGFREIISESQNIVVVEWPEKVRKILPHSVIWIKFEFSGDKNKRRIFFSF